jgi:hypothetical protein
LYFVQLKVAYTLTKLSSLCVFVAPLQLGLNIPVPLDGKSSDTSGSLWGVYLPRPTHASSWPCIIQCSVHCSRVESLIECRHHTLNILLSEDLSSALCWEGLANIHCMCNLVDFRNGTNSACLTVWEAVTDALNLNSMHASLPRMPDGWEAVTGAC